MIVKLLPWGQSVKTVYRALPDTSKLRKLFVDLAADDLHSTGCVTTWMAGSTRGLEKNAEFAVDVLEGVMRHVKGKAEFEGEGEECVFVS